MIISMNQLKNLIYFIIFLNFFILLLQRTNHLFPQYQIFHNFLAINRFFSLLFIYLDNLSFLSQHNLNKCIFIEIFHRLNSLLILSIINQLNYFNL